MVKRALHLVRLPSLSTLPSRSKRQNVAIPNQDSKIKNKPKGQVPHWLVFWLIISWLLSGSSLLGAWLLFKTPSPNCNSLSKLAVPGNYLSCALKAANAGTSEELAIAMHLVEKVPEDHSLYNEAHKRLREWSEQTLALASQKMRAGDLESAIIIANRVPLSSPFYPDAQAAIATWQEEWQKGEEITRQFQAALDAKQWYRATQLFLSLSRFESAYWRTVRADELMFELSQAKASAQRSK